MRSKLVFLIKLSIPEFLDVSSLGLSLTDPISISASPTALANFVLSESDTLENYAEDIVGFKIPDSETVSVDDLEFFSANGVEFEGSLFLSDTSENLKEFLTSTNSALLDFVDNIVSIEAFNNDAPIEITWQEFQGLDGADMPQNAMKSIELVVSGTAQELNDLFEDFGTNFEDLANNISFRVTDGGELELSASNLDKLDGRVNGTVNLIDTSDGISSALDKAIPVNIKDIIVDNGEDQWGGSSC